MKKKRIAHYLFVCSLIFLSACQQQTFNQKPATTLNAEAAEINVKLGINYMQRGDNEIALKKLKKALKQSPNSVSAHNTIGLLYHRLAILDKAEKHFMKAVTLDPNYSEAQNNFGVFLCQQGYYQQAEKRFLMALKNPLYQSRPQALENAGLCAYLEPNVEQAESFFRQALQLNPRLSKSLLKMAELHYQKQDYLSAKAYLSRYKKIAQWDAASLFIAIKTADKLDDKNAVSSYKLLLNGKFPESDEALRVAKGKY